MCFFLLDIIILGRGFGWVGFKWFKLIDEKLDICRDNIYYEYICLLVILMLCEEICDY